MRRGLGKGLEELLAIYDREDNPTNTVKEVAKGVEERPVAVSAPRGNVSKINISEIYLL